MSEVLEELTIGFHDIVTTLSNFRGAISQLQNQIRTLEKTSKKHIKTLERELSKRKVKGKREPSGFAKPTKISNELCDFMNEKYGKEMARTEVTKYIIHYIRKNDLQGKENRKVIHPDMKLRSLLGLNEEDELTYFNLQGYMNKHFI